MYFIYKITNTLNNKCYIGSSTTKRGYNTRWLEHQKAARLPSNESYNYPLQKAIRKYGIEHFTYKIIVEHIPTMEDRIEQEKNAIIQYNCLANEGWGYNQTLFTDCALKDARIHSANNKKSCALVDSTNNIIQIYDSLHEAARENDLPLNAISSLTKVCNGEMRYFHSLVFRWIDSNGKVIIPKIKTRPKYTRICAISVRNPKQIEYYDSVVEAANLIKIDRGSIHKCLNGDKRYSIVKEYIFRHIDDNNNIIQNNLPLEEVLSKYIIIDNIGKTITEWANFLNITTNSIYAYIKKHNCSKKEAIKYYLQKGE